MREVSKRKSKVLSSVAVVTINNCVAQLLFCFWVFFYNFVKIQEEEMNYQIGEKGAISPANLLALKIIDSRHKSLECATISCDLNV